MDTIRFALPSKNKSIKKLLHFYWEVCPKYDDATGKLKQESARLRRCDAD